MRRNRTQTQAHASTTHKHTQVQASQVSMTRHAKARRAEQAFT